MDSLIQKYLDGELNEEESRQFLELLASDEDVNREVRALEELVDLVSRMESAAPSSGFTDRVMDEVRILEPSRPVSHHSFSGSRIRPRHLIPLAASWVLALGLGYLLSQGVVGNKGDQLGPNTEGQSTFVSATPGAGLKVVRLVYMPPENGVSRVRVAGSFNNWDPDKTPMRLDNGRWVTSLLLPPDSYEYMFVVDDDTWVTDPLALTTRDDGFGSRNAVLEIGL